MKEINSVKEEGSASLNSAQEAITKEIFKRFDTLKRIMKEEDTTISETV